MIIMDSKKLKSIGQACFGRSWQSQLADRLNIDRRTVSSWIKLDSVPEKMHDEIYQIIEVRYFELKKCYEMEKEK